MKTLPASYLPLILGVIVLGIPACSKKAVRSGGDSQALQEEMAKGREVAQRRSEFKFSRYVVSPVVMIRTAYGDWIAILRKNGWAEMPATPGRQAVATPMR